MALFDWLFGGSRTSVPQLDPASAHERLRKKDLILVDVRTENEWRSGVARGAHTVTLGDSCLVDKVYGLTREDTSKPVAVICRSGMRSGRAAKLLVQAGFTDVSNVRGGMMAWNAAGLPTKTYRG